MANVKSSDLAKLVKPCVDKLMTRKEMKKRNLIVRKRALVQWGSQHMYKMVEKNPAIFEAVILEGSILTGSIIASYRDESSGQNRVIPFSITINIPNSFHTIVYARELLQVLNSYKKNTVLDLQVIDNKLVLTYNEGRVKNVTKLNGLTENDVTTRIIDD
jgi:hypothetical protein